MTKNNNRIQRISQEIHKKLAIILQREVQDPRIFMATVSDVEVSYDLAYVKVFITFLHDSDPNVVKVGLQALHAAAGFIRKLIGKAMRLRVIPKLNFFYDNTLSESIRISTLINEIIKNDEKRRITSCNI
ncbi:30S ribosome-binding factor [Candidatus Profftia lariciata]|uniref:30S ribosome-binding factor RbfA n=1 Tax=Candidatus Profftia lariciata TaxID=1987921 RepID=UPI001D002038|nr:30S ribosome-binding factor RbfA [Candidatus Profftia lariciata]UDG81532.1 30S ribosome-binding factor [Candidatus Profftia lariciata]